MRLVEGFCIMLWCKCRRGGFRVVCIRIGLKFIGYGDIV